MPTITLTDALTPEEQKKLATLTDTMAKTATELRYMLAQPSALRPPTLLDLTALATKADDAWTEFMEILRLAEAINDDLAIHDDTLTTLQRFKLNELIRNATEAITAVWPAVNPWCDCAPLETIQDITSIADEAWGDFMHALMALEEKINGGENTP